ncbi:signal peptidase I [Rhodococcus fascians]|jgi:signal peptidase|uniref:signal peptidase I n=1 Tax=Rhodococcoides fascians TaxID=1828 RepID=UPI00050C5EFF|nr:signal peptidase I [Rhodococcus fascians]MBX5330822.1 signal peptidase I [Rhodococcus fascians]MBY4011019.1 signal peptidase I [Rhodococcus fascians]MBY4021482.1 signal peptidase I [Rhodococcus fascians]MBY4057576.1 signal peptidase I [Rhodococcus fascians]MBY4066882.1 signal peptidase I [Rhodococcus fascians]
MTSVGEHRAASKSTGVRWWIGHVLSWTALLFVVAVLLASIVVPKLGNAMPLTVLTSSMEPTYPPGTLIVVRQTDVENLGVGEAITYQIKSGEPGVITHRIVGTTFDKDGKQLYITQGDNNSAPDQDPVRPVQVRGTVWYSIPYLGYVNNWITGERRSVFVGVVVAGLLAFALYQFVGAGLDSKRARKKTDL